MQVARAASIPLVIQRGLAWAGSQPLQPGLYPGEGTRAHCSLTKGMEIQQCLKPIHMASVLLGFLPLPTQVIQLGNQTFHNEKSQDVTLPWTGIPSHALLCYIGSKFASGVSHCKPELFVKLEFSRKYSRAECCRAIWKPLPSDMRCCKFLKNSSCILNKTKRKASHHVKVTRIKTPGCKEHEQF